MNAVATAESVVKTHALEGIGLAGAGLNGDSKVTESLTTSCAYDHLCSFMARHGIKLKNR